MIFSTMFFPTAILLPRYGSVYYKLGNGVSTVSDPEDRHIIRKAGGEINRRGASRGGWGFPPPHPYIFIYICGKQGDPFFIDNPFPHLYKETIHQWHSPRNEVVY